MSSRKRKTGLAKRATARGPIGMPRFHAGMGMGVRTENEMMEAEERAQRRVDNFWGQDKDFNDRGCEKLLMQIEDGLSREVEEYYHLEELHRQWDRDYVRNKDSFYQGEQNHKQSEREKYIKLISTSSISSETIIHTIWNNSTKQPSAFAQGFSPNNDYASTSLASHPMAHHSESDAAAQENRDIEQTGPVHMSIHLDGLQQSKAIIDKATYSFKQALKRLNANSNDMENNTQPFDAGQVSFEKKETKVMNAFLEKTVKTIDTSAPSTAVWESLNTAPRHIDAVDGHPEYQWDQEAMLLTVFNYLDTGAKGYLHMEDVAPIAHDLYVHSLLKFTVFWSIVKKKRWSYFPTLFEKVSKAHKNNNYFISESLFNYNVPAPPPLNTASGSVSSSKNGGASGVGGGGGGGNHKNVILAPLQSSQMSVGSGVSTSPSLTYADWIAAAEALAKETKIRARYIRTAEDHARISSAKGPAAFRPNDDDEVQREAFMSRVLCVGDVVWALHARSCVWLPAVIERVHTCYDVDEYGPAALSVEQRGHNSHGYFTYDVWYPISQRLLHQSRAMSASRQLLTLPSSMDNSLLHPKPLAGERNVCAFAFDLVDQAGSGVVELEKLIACFLSLEFRKIVNTSLALYTIFATARQRKKSVSHSPVARGGALPPVHHNGSQSTTNVPFSFADNSLADEGSLAYLMEGDSVNTAELNDFFEKNVPVFSILDKAKIPCLLPVFVDTFSYKPPAKFETSTNTGAKPSKRLSMEVEDSNLRELLLLHGHLPAEIASMTKRSSTEVQSSDKHGDSSMALSQDNQMSQDLQEHRVDWISKLDFLEFCAATVDIIQYSIV